MDTFDLIVIGSGPAGEKAAVKAAYFGHRVALVERAKFLGGAGVLTGTLPSKTLKETALYLSGKADKGLYGINRDLEKEATVEHFLYRKNWIIETESREVRENILRHNVTLFSGEAYFENEYTIGIRDGTSGENPSRIRGHHIIISSGSYPFHPPNIPFDRKRVHDSDSILNIQTFPHSIVILGAGVIGLEYATIFSTMGSKVYLINRSDRILNFVDTQIVKELIEAMKEDGIQLLFNKNLKSIEVPPNEEDSLKIILESGELIESDMFLFAAGRNGTTKPLKLEEIGIEVDNRENIPVNEKYQTRIPHIYAVGDVIGFPALASTSMDQGRVAVAHIFKTRDLEALAQILPYGIYTVPEISTVGKTEDEMRAQGSSFLTGVARHKDMPRGKIMGASVGLLKIVFTLPDLVVCGVHIIGPLATELVHFGVELIHQKKTLYDMISRVYNTPTLHELYKYAAYDGLSNVAGHKVKP